MRTPEETAAWIVDLLGWIYSRPQMYAQTQSELDGQIRMLHFTWAFVVDRLDEYRSQQAPMGKNCARSPRGFFDKVKTDRPLKKLVKHWREIDERLGIEAPVIKLPKSSDTPK